MLSPKYVRENMTHLGHGNVVTTDGLTHEGLEVYSGNQTTITCIRSFAQLLGEDPRESVFIFPTTSVVHIALTSWEESGGEDS